jgi:pyrroloquinoline quinone (PQQ) biosynthesis protein C
MLTQVPTKEQVVKQFEEWGKTHSLHTHGYLNWLFDEGNNDLESVKRFCEALYVFCNVFHKCLFEILAKSGDEKISRDIVYNLYDEFGAGDPEHGHLELMRRLLRSIGYTDEAIDDISLNPGAQEFMNEILNYCQEEATLKAIGCICIGAECNGSVYFTHIYNAFVKKACLKDADLYVLKIHAGDDIQHRDNMLALIDKYLSQPQDRLKIFEGFLASVHLFQKLWTSMAYFEGISIKVAATEPSAVAPLNPS